MCPLRIALQEDFGAGEFVGIKRIVCPGGIDVDPRRQQSQMGDRKIQLLVGFITGAPEIRAMEIIDEAEPRARSVYTKSIGFIRLNGNVCLNIAKRTIIIKHQKAFVQAGGGIVADSGPEAECQETITKAKALLSGIQAKQHG